MNSASRYRPFVLDSHPRVGGIDVSALGSPLRWEARMAARPGCIRCVDVPEPSDFFVSANKHIEAPRGLMEWLMGLPTATDPDR
jgi:hypothetical protein